MRRRDRDAKSRRPARVAAVGLALVLSQAALIGCRREPPPPSASVASAAPAVAPAAPSASALPPVASSSVSHAPGTMPKPPAPRASASAAPLPPPPTFARLAAARTRATSGSKTAGFLGGRLSLTSSTGVWVLDPSTGAGFTLSEPDASTVEPSPDKKTLAVVRADRVTLWDTDAGTLLHTFVEPVSALAFSPDGKKLATTDETIVVVRDASSGAELRRFTPELPTHGITFSRGDAELLLTSSATRISVYSTAMGTELRGGGGADTTATFALIVSGDGRFAAASAPAGHGLQVFDVHAWGPRTLVTLPEGACDQHIFPSFSANGRLVFAAGGERWVKAFDVGSWKPNSSYHAAPGRLVAARADDLSRVIVTRADRSDAVVVNVSNTAETKLAKPLPAEASYAMSADGLWIAGTHEATVRVWSSKTGAVQYEESP